MDNALIAVLVGLRPETQRLVMRDLRESIVDILEMPTPFDAQDREAYLTWTRFIELAEVDIKLNQ